MVITTTRGERPDSARFCIACMLWLLLEICEYFCMVKYLSKSAIQTKNKRSLWMSFEPSNQCFTEPYPDYPVICTVLIFKVVKCLNDLQITWFKMESKLDILRKATQEGKMQYMLGRGRKRLHKTQEKPAELTQFDCPAIFPPTRVSSAVWLLAWTLSQKQKLWVILWTSQDQWNTLLCHGEAFSLGSRKACHASFVSLNQLHFLFS